jgi:predicted DNA-binding protein YlxM (UPF0122 family)
MYIKLKEVANNLNVKEESIYKVLNRCGYAKTTIITKNDAETLINCLNEKRNRYETKLLILELENQIKNLYKT